MKTRAAVCERWARLKHWSLRWWHGKKPDRRSTASRLARAMAHVASNEAVVLDLMSVANEHDGGWCFDERAEPWLRVLAAFSLPDLLNREPFDVLGLTLNKFNMVVSMDPGEISLDEVVAFVLRARIDESDMLVSLFPVVTNRRTYAAYLHVRGTTDWIRRFMPKSSYPIAVLGLHYRLPGTRWRLMVKATSAEAADRLLPMLLMAA